MTRSIDDLVREARTEAANAYIGPFHREIFGELADALERLRAERDEAREEAKFRLQLAEDARDKLSQEYARVVARCVLAEDVARAAEELSISDSDGKFQSRYHKLKDAVRAWRAGRGDQASSK